SYRPGRSQTRCGTRPWRRSARSAGTACADAWARRCRSWRGMRRSPVARPPGTGSRPARSLDHLDRRNGVAPDRPVTELALVVQAPAIRLAVGLYAAGYSAPGADRHEAEPTGYVVALRRRVAARVSRSTLRVGVLTPAVRRARRARTAGVHRSRAHGREVDVGRGRLPFGRVAGVEAPTVHLGVRGHAAGALIETRAHRRERESARDWDEGKRPRGRRRSIPELAHVVDPRTVRLMARGHAAGMIFARAHHRERQSARIHGCR